MEQQGSFGVIGAGNMGSGIAQKLATEGCEVVLVDLDQAAVDRGMERIRALLGEAVERRIFRAEEVARILSRIHPSCRLEDCSRCELVIEAVFEELELKRKLFAQLDEICSPSTRLATNTSSFYVKDLAAVTKRPDRVVGMHFFYHPAKNRLVEVIPHEGTNELTRSWAWTFAEMVGKTPIHSADRPGFVVNRYFVPWLNEAVRLLEEKIAPLATIEAAAKKAFRIGMGPFELMNVTGVPIAWHAATTLGRELGPFYEPAPLLAEKGERGENWDLEGEVDESKFEAVADRLLGVSFQIACAMVGEGVCSIEDCDIGARVGLRWSEGPFQLINRDGIERARARVEAQVARYPDLKMPPLLEQAKGPFAFELVKAKVEDGLAEITLNRPDALNALNEEVFAQLAAKFDEMEHRDEVSTIVLRGAGKAFVAGADIRYFVKRIEAKDFQRIQEFTEEGQELYRRIDESEKLVIARLDGLSLGGGSELALCADWILATDKGSMGFPETGIGIYPGLGGTQRTRRRIGSQMTRYLLLTGDSVDAQSALAMGLVDEIVPVEQLSSRIKALHTAGKSALPNSKAKAELPLRLKALRDFFGAAELDALLTGQAQAEDPAVAKAAARVARKAPLACRVVDAAIARGEEAGLQAGLKEELAHLKEIFASEDAYEGLSSLGRRRPEFKGR